MQIADDNGRWCMVGGGDYKVQCVTTFVSRFKYVLLQAMVVEDGVQLYSADV